MPETAFEIQNGQELERFCPNQVQDRYRTYLVLTGNECPGHCFWCGREFDEKSKARHRHYCYGHMAEYYKHFFWQSARNWCIERQDFKCANCGVKITYSDEVHHIVPLKGERRDISPFNLPWNLMAFCHVCHQEVHRVMKRACPLPSDKFELAIAQGQGIFSGILE